MKRLGPVPCLVLIVALVAGCGGPMVEVNQRFQQTTDFTKYKTYAWLDGGSRSDLSAGSRDIDVDGTIRKAVEKQMAEKGFVKVSAEPDLLIKYYAGLRNTTYVTDFGMHYQEKVGWSESQTVQDGQLTVDFMDRKTDTVVWRGVAWGAMNVDPNQTIVTKNVNHAVQKMFQQYPPDPAKDAGGARDVD